MKKLKNNTIIAIIIIAVLVVVFSVLLVFYLKDINYEEGKITIINGENDLGNYSFEELEDLCQSQTFTATYKPSGKLPKEKEYSGIELKELFSALDIDYQNSQGVLFTASDGMQKIYSADDIKQDSNVFIANKVEGKPFNKSILPNAYSKPQEDGGPFVVIKANDNVSQNRVKMLVRIEVL